MPPENRDTAVLTSLEVRPSPTSQPELCRKRSSLQSPSKPALVHTPLIKEPCFLDQPRHPLYLFEGSHGSGSNISIRVILQPPFFFCFFFPPKLQSEVRMIIWCLNLELRVVKIEYHDKKGFGQRMEYDDNNVPTLREPSPTLINVPTALSVCRDSRASVIELYSL